MDTVRVAARLNGRASWSVIAWLSVMEPASCCICGSAGRAVAPAVCCSDSRNLTLNQLWPSKRSEALAMGSVQSNRLPCRSYCRRRWQRCCCKPRCRCSCCQSWMSL